MLSVTGTTTRKAGNNKKTAAASLINWWLSWSRLPTSITFNLSWGTWPQSGNRCLTDPFWQLIFIRDSSGYIQDSLKYVGILWTTFFFFFVLFSLEIVQNASWVKHFGDKTGCNEALIEERLEVSGTTRKWDEAPNQCLNTTSAPTSSYLNIYWEKYETVDWFEEVTVFSKTFGPDALCMLRGDSLTRALVKFKRRISRSINQLYDIYLNYILLTSLE